MIFRIFSRVPFWKPAKNCSCPRKCLLPFNEYILQFPATLWGSWVWHLFVLPNLCPDFCLAAGMEGIWLYSISDCKSHLCVDPLLKRIPHCATASKSQSKALDQHKINPPGEGFPETSQFLTLTADICVLESRSTPKEWLILHVTLSTLHREYSYKVSHCSEPFTYNNTPLNVWQQHHKIEIIIMATL